MTNTLNQTSSRTGSATSIYNFVWINNSLISENTTMLLFETKFCTVFVCFTVFLQLFLS